MKATAKSVKVTTKDPFGISRTVTTARENIFLDIDGKGFGEASANSYYGETPQTVLSHVLKLEEVLGNDPHDLERILDRLDKMVKLNPAFKAMVDMALYDLIGKELGLPLYKLWGLNPEDAPQSSFTIGLDTIPEMVRKLKEAEEYPIIKVKLGTDHDEEIIEALREETDKVIRVDANAAWTAKEAIYKIDFLEAMGIEFVEQPLPPDDIEGGKEVYRNSRLPIVLDESVKTSMDIPKVVGMCDGINIKLMKSGGLREALRMISVARANSLQIMVGCMLESSLSVTAAAHFTPLVDWADLDGALLLADDPYEGMWLEDGWIKIPDRPGIGAVPRK